jgi:hypothetical protein
VVEVGSLGVQCHGWFDHGMFADTGAPLAPCVYATDAQGHDDGDDWGGYGIVGTPVTEDYAQMLFARGTRPGRNVAKLDGSLGTKHASYLTPTVPFSRLPDSLFHHRRHWTVLGSGRWRFDDHITLGEGRAVFKLFATLAAHSGSHRSKVLSLQDNMPTAYAWARGRSSSIAVNYILRRTTAHCIGSEITAALPWVETSKQPADDASRGKDALWSKQNGPAPTCPGDGDDGFPLQAGSPAFRRVAHWTCI